MPDKPTLVFIHGFPLDHRLWDGQVDALGDVAHILAPDLRGFGNDQRAVPEVLTMEAMAEDLKELLDQHDVERTVLCGLSMGGYVAMAFAARWPDRVHGMVLANTRANADDADGVAARKTLANDATTKGMAVIGRAMAPKLLARGSAGERPELLDTLHAMIARQRPEAVAAAAYGMAKRPDRSAELRNWTFPTLVITGDDDMLMPLPTSQAMAHAIPDARLTVIEGAGHLSNAERPDAFNAELRAFLLGLSTSS